MYVFGEEGDKENKEERKGNRKPFEYQNANMGQTRCKGNLHRQDSAEPLAGLEADITNEFRGGYLVAVLKLQCQVLLTFY